MGNERAAFGRAGGARVKGAVPRAARNVAGLPLLCGWGRHDCAGLAQWNDGYYFARCRRCGHDVVRTAFGGWTIPRGFRVVWGDHPPQAAPRAQLIAIGEATKAPPGRVEFPIVEPSPPLRTIMPDAAMIAPETKSDAAAATTGDNPPHSSNVFPVVGSVIAAEPDAAPSVPEAAAVETPSIGQVLEAPRDGDTHHAADTNHAADTHRDEAPASSPAILFRAEDERSNDRVEEPHVLRAPSDEPAPPQVEDKDVDVPETAPELPAAIEPELIPPPLEVSAVLPSELAPTALPDPTPVTPVESTPVPPPEAPPPKPLIPDFMTETAFDVPYDLTTGEILRRREQEASQPSASPPSVTSQPPSVQVAPIASMPGSGPVELRVEDLTPGSRNAPAPDGRSVLERYSSIAAATIFGAFVLAAAVVTRSDAESTPTGYRPIVRAAPNAAPIPALSVASPAVPVLPAYRTTRAVPAITPTDAAPTGDLAFVTASTLNCRATPDDAGRTVRKLLRGASVQVLGAGSGWVSVSHRGQRCWAAAEYVSAVRPS